MHTDTVAQGTEARKQPQYAQTIRSVESEIILSLSVSNFFICHSYQTNSSQDGDGFCTPTEIAMGIHH